MNHPFDEYGDVLRRALHAEADAVMPEPDGLERIRGRIAARERRDGWGWLTTSWARPVLAGAAALLLAALAVSAPPAIDKITSAGDQSTASRSAHPRGTLGERGSPGSSNLANPGGPQLPPRSSSSAPGAVPPSSLSPCPTPSASPTVTATPRRTPKPKIKPTPHESPCQASPTGTPTPNPTTSGPSHPVSPSAPPVSSPVSPGP
jgi:hypothetical protein